MNIPQPNSSSNADKQYLHTLSAGAFLPFMQATGFGLAIFAAVWVIASVVFDAIDPHKPALLFGVIAWVVMLYRLFRHWLNLTTFETVIQRDINGDGVIGQQEQVPAEDDAPIFRVQLIKANGHVSDTFDLPGGEQAFRTLSKGIINGMPISERMWTPKKKGKPYGSDTWRKLRDVMIARELWEYVDPENKEQGMRSTPDGLAFHTHFAELPHSPTETSEA